MAETFFLSSVAKYLTGAVLVPALKVGVAEPGEPTELPAIVLSLEATARANPGVGGGAERVVGILPWQASIDLAHPFLPEEPTFSLLGQGGLTLTLPHGGLVRKDGSEPGFAPLAPEDITVDVPGDARTVTTGVPAANEVRADGRTGTLTFGAPLPPTAIVTVSYFLGQWERRVERISGTLRLDVCAGTAEAAATLSDAAIDALLAPAARQKIERLLSLAPTSLGSVGTPEASPPLRRRSARLTFTFEREVNRPDSSGGIIDRITVTSHLGNGGTPPGITPRSTEISTIGV